MPGRHLLHGGLVAQQQHRAIVTRHALDDGHEGVDDGLEVGVFDALAGVEAVRCRRKAEGEEGME